MKIENIGTEIRSNRARIYGTVKWEDCGRPDQIIYFETDPEFSQALYSNPHSFLIGATLPAMHYGETRVYIDAAACPELIDGLLTVMHWMRNWWYDPNKKLPLIETKIKPELTSPQVSKRAALFFSGGIDSLATLRYNHAYYPLNHPQYIRDGLLVYGLEVEDPKAFEIAKKSVDEIARDCQITLIPVYTNLRMLNDDWVFWRRSYQGAVFSAIAHAFSQRLSSASISSSHCICYSPHYGTHPLIDPNFSSSDFQIKHTCYRLSRLDKTKLIADWDVALRNLRVCNKYNLYRPKQLNCGQCEKCLITMMDLIAIGALDCTSAFGGCDVSADKLKATMRINPEVEHYYEELIIPLTQKDRKDLAHVIKDKLTQYRKKVERSKLLGINSVANAVFRSLKHKPFWNSPVFFSKGCKREYIK